MVLVPKVDPVNVRIPLVKVSACESNVKLDSPLITPVPVAVSMLLLVLFVIELLIPVALAAISAYDAEVAYDAVALSIPVLPAPVTVYVNGAPIWIAIGAGLFKEEEVVDSTIVNANDRVSAVVKICIADLDEVIANDAVAATPCTDPVIPPVTLSEPVIPNDPVIKADPVNGKVITDCMSPFDALNLGSLSITS
jgi:hypothetical protein